MRALRPKARVKLRDISEGVELPSVVLPTVRDISTCAILDYRLNANGCAPASLPAKECDANPPGKIALYRILQEALLKEGRLHGPP